MKKKRLLFLFTLTAVLCFSVSSCNLWHNNLFPDLTLRIDAFQYNSGKPLVFQKGVNGEFTPETGKNINITGWTTEGGSLPVWLSFNESTGVFSGTPDSYIGKDDAVKITVTAFTDGEGPYSKEVTIGADDPADITAPDEIPVFVKWGSEKNFAFTVTGTPDELKAEGLPDELSFSAEEKTVSGKITDNEAKTYSCKVKAKTSWGTESECSFEITVEPPFNCEDKNVYFFNGWSTVCTNPIKNPEISGDIAYTVSGLPVVISCTSGTSDFTFTSSGNTAVQDCNFTVTGTKDGKNCTLPLTLKAGTVTYEPDNKTPGNDYTMTPVFSGVEASDFTWSDNVDDDDSYKIKGNWGNVGCVEKREVMVSAEKGSCSLSKTYTYLLFQSGCLLSNDQLTVSGTNTITSNVCTDNINSIVVNSGAQLTVPSDGTAPGMAVQQMITFNISNAADLNHFAEAVNSGLNQVTGKVTADIDRSTETNELQISKDDSESSRFKGTLESQGEKKTISRMTKKLLVYIDPEGAVNNLSFNVNIYREGIQAAAAAINKGTISNCTVSGTVESTSDYAVGLVCYNYGNVNDCTVSGTVKSTSDYAVGLVCYNYGNVNDCTVSGTVTSTSNYAGGLVCLNSGNVSGCIFSGSVNGVDITGGIAAENLDGIIDGCTVDAKVFSCNSDNYIYSISGGIAGSIYSGEIRNCCNTGKGNTKGITASNASYNFAGGIAGYCDETGIVKNCYNKGTVLSYSTNSASGGIAGIMFVKSSAENCFNDKDCSISASVSSGTCVGFIDGNCTGTIRFLYGFDGAVQIIGNRTCSDCYQYNDSYIVGTDYLCTLLNTNAENMGTDYWSWTTNTGEMPELVPPSE